MTRNLRNLTLNKPLRTEWQYCNIMYTVASHLVETVSGERYADFLKTKFWKPLQMSNTHHDFSGVHDDNAAGHLARGYVWKEETNSYDEVPMYDQPEGQGAGSIYSSVNDYAKWVRAMIKGTVPLSQDTQKELVKPRAITTPDDDDDLLPFFSHALYALGWIVENYRGHRVIGHDGSMTGFKSTMKYLPDKNWGVVIFGNSDGCDDAMEVLAMHLVDDILNVPVSERVDWPDFQRERDANYKAKGNDNPDLPTRPENPLPMSVPLEKFAGKYHNTGYHDLILEVKDSQLQADCMDRCFGFQLFWEHISGDVFVVEKQDMLDGTRSRFRTEFKFNEEGRAIAVGVEFVEEMKDYLVWFNRVE